jgi:hypothetical protein
VTFDESFIFVVAYGGIALLLTALLFRMTTLSLPMLADHRVEALNAESGSIGEGIRSTGPEEAAADFTQLATVSGWPSQGGHEWRCLSVS